jgi:hypothetical protein
MARTPGCGRRSCCGSEASRRLACGRVSWGAAACWYNPVVLLSIFVLALATTTGTTTPGPSPTPAALSRDQAESLRVKVLELEKRAKAPRPVATAPASVLVTQGELNSYINLAVGQQLPAGLRDVEFRLDSSRIDVRSMVDLDQVKAHMGATSFWNPLALLSGMVSLEIAGRLRSEGGFGTFEIDDIRIGPVALPPALLAQLVASSTRTQQNPAGFDVLSPFRLPYGLKKVRVQPGRMSLDY